MCGRATLISDGSRLQVPVLGAERALEHELRGGPGGGGRGARGEVVVRPADEGVVDGQGDGGNDDEGEGRDEELHQRLSPPIASAGVDDDVEVNVRNTQQDAMEASMQ